MTPPSAHEKPDEPRQRSAALRCEHQQHGSLQAKRLIIASGITDKLPDIPGPERHWGKAYCTVRIVGFN